jgi:hypothetical protein
VTDIGVPPASTTVVSYIDIVSVNDHAPSLTVRVSGTCNAETSSILHERFRRDAASEKSKRDPQEAIDDQRTREVRSACSVN